MISDAHKFSLNPTHYQTGNVLVGNKKLIMADMLNSKLDEEYVKSHRKTGRPLDSMKQTYYMEERQLVYDHKTMAKKFMQQVKEDQFTQSVVKMDKKRKAKSKDYAQF